MTFVTHLPVLFRGTDADHAVDQARAWARAEGLDAEVAGTRRRFDLPTWGADGDPTIDLLAFEVMVVVVGPVSEQLRLPELGSAVAA